MTAPPRTVLLLDTETTGVESDAVAIEVAVALYSVPHAAVVRSFSSLIRADANPAEKVNGIPVSLLAEALPPERVWPSVAAFAERSEAIVAHNADFDRRFVPASLASRPWICSMDDIAWPRGQAGMSLIGLALAHGLGVSHAHRAAVDVDMLGRLLSRVAEMGHDLGAMLVRGLRPKATFQALVLYERNHEAKAAGFRWDGDAKRWWRSMAIEDAATLPFKVRQIDGAAS